jgi:hypothetical protein
MSPVYFVTQVLSTLRSESTGTSFTFETGDMVYNPHAVKVALVEGVRRVLPVWIHILVVVEAVGMW